MTTHVHTRINILTPSDTEGCKLYTHLKPNAVHQIVLFFFVFLKKKVVRRDLERHLCCVGGSSAFQSLATFKNIMFGDECDAVDTSYRTG